MYEIKTLSNNLKIVYEKIPYARSVTAGVWVLSGSRTEDVPGVSHFIEHMLFKGTKNRTAFEIAKEMDETGGQLNAYTTREYTVFYSTTTEKHVKTAFSLLSDMVRNSVFLPDDIEKEKNVVLEEIAMYEDSPEDLVFDLLEENAWKGSTLGRSITGTRESVISINRDIILSHMEGFYVPENMVIAVAGAIDEDEILDLAEKYFGGMKDTPPRKVATEKPVFFKGSHREIKDIGQTNIAIGFEGLSYHEPLRFPLMVLNNAFGGGMSSRLFQKIRETDGLAYSVYTSLSGYSDTGLFAIYGGMKNENTKKVKKIIDEEIMRLLENGLTEDEIARGKEQLSGGIILGGESVSARMSKLGKGILLGRGIKEDEEIIEKIRKVTKGDVLDIARKVLVSEKRFIETVSGK